MGESKTLQGQKPINLMKLTIIKHAYSINYFNAKYLFTMNFLKEKK